MSASATIKPEKHFFDAEGRHRLRWRTAVVVAVSFLVALALEGYSFYSLPQVERVHHTAYDLYSPSGDVGLKLGIGGGVLFLLIYLYPIRKRWPWLRKIGNTKHWLDFHILLGLFGPLVITFHSSFKFHGLAGIAFWIMWTVALSGIVGKYFYAQIPRRLTAAEMDRKEIEEERERTSSQLSGQDIFSSEDLATILNMPTNEAVEQLGVMQALVMMVQLDARRFVQVSRLRRKGMSAPTRLLSLGGLLPLGNRALERVISSVRQQAWLSTKILFLGKTQKLFHLWHVVHRPFSYSFAVLVIVHIGFVVALGYF
jgi:hypothetical protein